MPSKKNTRSRTKSTAPASAADVAAPEAEAPTATDATNDDAVEAALAMLDAQLSGETQPSIADADTTPEGTDEAEATDGEVVTELTDPAPEDVEAALAEFEKQSAPEDAEKPKGSTKSKKEPTEPTVVREFVSVAKIDQATLDANLNAISAKKVQEKAQNLIQAIQSGKKLSGYTKRAVQVLIDEGKVSGKMLVDAYLGAGLKEGTARAQAQQMTALFKAVGLASPADGAPRELLIADNDLAKELLAAA